MRVRLGQRTWRTKANSNEALICSRPIVHCEMTEKEHHGRHGVRTSRQTPQLHQSSLICYLHWTFLSPSDSRMMYLRLTLSTTSSPRKGTGFPGKSKVVCLQVEVVARRQYDRKARKSLHVRIKNLLHHSRGLLHFTEIQAK